jgi:hypothetical protein
MMAVSLSTWATVATAVGTLALAGATYCLARGTAREVRAANAQAHASAEQSVASREQSEASQRQAEAAERALTAQTAPLLSDVPFGIPMITGYRLVQESGRQSVLAAFMGRREPTYGDASEISAYIDEHGHKDVNIDVPIRNIAQGVAIIDTVTFRTKTGAEISGTSATPVLPSGEITASTTRLPPAAVLYREAASIVANRERFTLLIAYSDAAGTPHAAIRLDVAPETPIGDEKDDGWFVEQVHWGSSLAEVRDRPRVSSRQRSA